MLCSLLLLAACSSSKNNKGTVPRITFEGLSADSVQMVVGEGLVLSFGFVDGDGDLVVKRTSGKKDIYLKDSRDSSYNLSFYFPANTVQYANTKTGISGICNVEISASLLKLRPDHPTRDTLEYEYYIVDKAGNESNHLKTGPIYLIRP